MPIDGLTVEGILLIVGVLLVVPFLTPAVTAIVMGLILKLDISALWWSLLFGVLTVPLMLVLSSYLGDWTGWTASLVVSVLFTAGFLWSWARWRAHR